MERSAAIHPVAPIAIPMTCKTLLLSGVPLLLFPVPALAQETIQAPPEAEQQVPGSEPLSEYDEDDEEPGTIVVTGARPRGSVIGDIPPENVLDSRDVRATGATDIDELLEALEPQIGSARGRDGGRPIMLLNGQRISSFRELRDIPTEAISRVEILPEEVALKYGYRADQRVVNIVLRERFRSTVARVEGTAATEGGYLGGEADLTRLMIGENSRTTIDLDAVANGPLTEAERDILLDPDQDTDDRAARSLVASRRQITGTLTHHRQLGAVGATGNIELEHNEGRSLIGLGETLLEPLARDTTNDSAHAGGVLNGNLGEWRWSVTGNADAARSVTDTDRDSGLRDRAETNTLSGDVDAVANGNLFRLPAGDAGATVKLGGSTLHLESDRRRGGLLTANSLARTRGSAAANLDFPVSRRNSDFGALGNLTLNGNAEVEQLSDFGTLATIGAGANWSPEKRLDLIASWTREDGVPTVQQLGDPILETPDTRIFDFTTGETVLVTAITGGNPDLLADRRNVVKLGANWRPFTETDLRLRADYVRTTVDDLISSFPGPTAELEAAFPERFVRNSEGELVAVDLRPVNYDRSRRDTLRLGFDFSQPLRSARPSQAAIEAFRSRRAAAGESAPPAPQAGEGGSQGGGFRGLGRFGGEGRRGGRLTFSITDTITLVDEVLIRPGLPKLDYLHGDALGQLGGRPRHEVEARAGYFNNGLGARLSADWRSGTRVNTAEGDQLRFSPLATFDLRLWADFGQRFELVAKHPWLRGSSVRFEVNNLFDSKPRVRDSAGKVPFSYQPDLLDPLGRTISITFR
ncbi:MAG TPA: TonB-dependent receptor, partial [Sphingomicrobium sp.]|nr:TonB-dependent receptor [Sphingomicrobium sp.]